MKICYLANAASVHTQRWARHFADLGYWVTVISFEPAEIDGVTVYPLNNVSSHRRLGIILSLGRVRRLVRQIAPDVLHVHYVTSYGLAGALAGWHPLAMTAWGSDVLVMPEQSWVYRQIVRFALSRADLVTSMADHMTRHLVERRYASATKIVTLPFGVDINVFNLEQRSRQHGEDPALVVSTRRLDEGLDVHLFILAVPQILARFPGTCFVVIGDGPLRSELEQLASDLGVSDQIDFRGSVAQREIPEQWLAALSRSPPTSRQIAPGLSLEKMVYSSLAKTLTHLRRAWLMPSCIRNGDETWYRQTTKSFVGAHPGRTKCLGWKHSIRP
jgi:L-malate glycosyltransferase